jgi:hypothetical protein
MRVASVLPFRTTYDLNGLNFIEHQLRHGKIGFRDNASVAVDEVAVLQASAGKLSPIRKRLDYWTFHRRPEIRGPHRKRLTLTSTSLVRKPPLASSPTTIRIAQGHCIVDDASRTQVGYMDLRRCEEPG